MMYYPGMCVIEIERVIALEKRFGERLLRRIFTEGELSYCLPRAARYQHLASRLAAKIAVRRALRQAGMAMPPYRCIEVKRDEWGKPSIALAYSPRRAGETAAPFSILLSLSHGRRYAVSSGILVCEGNMGVFQRPRD
jgi:holo-[acyl-carrier protein] synthase